MKRSTKLDISVAITGAIILAAGILGHDTEARYLGLFILAKALPRPSEYARIGRSAKEFIRKGRA